MATVSRLTGFKPELLRAWETRHQLLAPSRGPGGQRLYSDSDLALLLGVRALVDEGRSIGEIAALGRRQLLELSRTRATDSARPATLAPVAALPVADELEPAAWTPRPAGGLSPTAPGTTRALSLAANAVVRLSARLEPGQLLQLVAETLAEDFQAALARLWVADPTAELLHLRASAGLSRRTQASSRARIDLRTYRFKVGVVARTGTPFLSNRIVGDLQFDQRWVHKERLASVAILPLRSDEGLHGVLAAFFRVALNEEVVGALRMFAAIAAGSLAAHEHAARARLSA